MQAASQLEQTRTVRRAPLVRRLWMVLGVLGALLLMALLPPYLNVNRYQRRITQSISESLGRPVHLDHVTLNLLPTPGFTLERFVVSEDPAFGSEPVIRADTVRATLRVSTLWRRRIEFATISLTEPSVNLVHTADGRWNLDSILLQAARLDAAPTAQRTAGAAARFPYIEATGARVNLKMDEEKMPEALTEADFAMWLPQPERWNFRIKARPARTDLPVGYTGLLRLEGTVGRAAVLGDIPLDLRGEWRGVPTGEMSRIVLGRDVGWRGAVTVTASAQGTVGRNRVVARVRLEDVRRESFVPARLMSVTLECAATVTHVFHGLSDGLCRVPAGGTAGVTVSGALEDVRRLGGAVGKVEVGPVGAAGMIDLLHTLSVRVPAGLALGGVLSGGGTYGEGELAGSLLLRGGSLRVGEQESIALGDAVIRVQQADGAETPAADRATDRGALVLIPTTLELGGREPAMLDGKADAAGYALHLSGAATAERLRALGAAVPQLGDGLEDVLPESAPGDAPKNSPGASPAALLRVDLIATRRWGGPQVWRAAAPRPAAPAGKRRRRPRR